MIYDSKIYYFMKNLFLTILYTCLIPKFYQVINSRSIKTELKTVNFNKENNKASINKKRYIQVNKEMYLEEKLKEWKKCRLRTKRKLIELADKLDNLQKNMIITRATGLAITIAGNATTLTGILLAPKTFGLSLSLAIGGTAVGAIGSITSIWGVVKKDIITKFVCREAECLLNEDKKNSEELVQIFSSSHFRRQMENGIGGLIGKFGQEGINIANLLTHAISTQNSSNLTSAKFLVNPNPFLHYFGIGLSLLFVGLEFVRLVETTIELKEGAKCVFSDQIRKLAVDSTFNMNDFERLIYNEIKLKMALKSF